jgi:hypothetical protein
MFKFNNMSAAQLDQAVEQFKRNAETPVHGPPEDAGEKLTAAVKRRLASSSRVAFFASAPDEPTFAQKIVDATKKILATRNGHTAPASKTG